MVFLIVALILGHCFMPLYAMQPAEHHSRTHIVNTFTSLAEGRIDLDTVFKLILPPEVTKLIVRYAYHKEFNSFFSSDRLWFRKDKYVTSSKVATEEQKKVVVTPMPNIADQYETQLPEHKIVCAMRYGADVLMATAENKFFVVNFATQELESFEEKNNKARITYLYKNRQQLQDGRVYVGFEDGSVGFCDPKNIVDSGSMELLSGPITQIVMCDNNTKLLISSHDTCILLALNPLVDKKVTGLKSAIIYSSEKIGSIGFSKRDVIIQPADELIETGAVQPYSPQDAETLKNCIFSPQQASLIYRLIQKKDSSTPAISPAEQAVFESISPTFQQVLMEYIQQV